MEEKKKISLLRLISSHHEVDNLHTFIFETGDLTWLPGQFQAYVLPGAGTEAKENERWFTISSAPSEKAIHISTRISESSFKKTLKALEIGEEIHAHSLGGDFLWESAGDRVVLVAGGIGATPYRSMLLERKALGLPLNATLLYFNRSNEIPFEKEFEKLSKENPEFVIKSIIGEALTADKILEIAPESKVESLYLSGAQPVVKSVAADLKNHGINAKLDSFPGYSESTY